MVVGAKKKFLQKKFKVGAFLKRFWLLVKDTRVVLRIITVIKLGEGQPFWDDFKGVSRYFLTF